MKVVLNVLNGSVIQTSVLKNKEAGTYQREYNLKMINDNIFFI